MIAQVLNGHMIDKDDKRNIRSFIHGTFNGKEVRNNVNANFVPATRWLTSTYGGSLKEAYTICRIIWEADKEPILPEDAFMYG